jgi:hypothetical protein
LEFQHHLQNEILALEFRYEQIPKLKARTHCGKGVDLIFIQITLRIYLLKSLRKVLSFEKFKKCQLKNNLMALAIYFCRRKDPNNKGHISEKDFASVLIGRRRDSAAISPSKC